MFDHLSVQEIIEKISSGVTEPYLCRLEDDGLYALKGRQALPRGLISEVICASLGQKLGLPIPEFVIADVDKQLFQAGVNPDFEWSIGEGPAFGSHWRNSTIPITRSWLGRVDSEVLARIYVFDHWVKNGDRTLTELGGNPNLLIDLESDSLVVIDHNLAFSNAYQPAELNLHACRDAWLDERQNLVFNQRCQSAMNDAFATVSELFAELPVDWLDAEPDMEQEIVTVLERFQTPEFWDELA